MRNSAKEKRRIPADARLESTLKRMRDSSRRYGKIDPLTVETFLSFIYAYNHVSTYLEKITREYGITRSGINVLTILRSSEGRGCNQQRLSRLLLVSRANVTGLIDGLIRKGLVRRGPDECDRRACNVNISQQGERLLDSILPQYHGEISRIYSGLSRTDKKNLNRTLRKLLVSMDRSGKEETR